MAELADALDSGFSFPRLIVFNDACISKGNLIHVDMCACMKVAQGPGGVPVVRDGQNGDALSLIDCFCNRRGAAFSVLEQAWREV